MRGVDRQHFIVTSERFINTIEREKRVAEIVEDFGMTRRQHQRVAILREGLFKAPHILEREAEIRQRIDRGRIGLHGFGQKADRLDVPATLQVDESEQMQRAEIVAAIVEDRGTQPFGLVEMALLARAEGLPLQTRQVRHSRRSAFPLSRQTGSSDCEFRELSPRLAAAFESFVAEKAIIFGLIRLTPHATPSRSPLSFIWSATCIEIA